jgi:hypothetical protein
MVVIKQEKMTLPMEPKKSIIIKNCSSERISNSSSRVKHNVNMLGDSHLKGCAVKLRSELSTKFEVSGVIRLGARTEKIVNFSVDDLQNLHLHDVIVHNAAANDVYRNAKGLALTPIAKLIQRNYDTNIIIIDIPQRYDLSPPSCINFEIEEFNRKLKTIATSYNNVSLLETNFKREYFTRYGLHWNSLGKTLVVNLILHQINKLIGKGVQIPINLVLKDNAMVGIVSSGNKGMTTLFGTVNGNGNLNNEDVGTSHKAVFTLLP